MKQTVIIIPCFNEEERLIPEAFLDFLKTNKKVDLLFINDGSRDDTLAILDKLVRQSPNCKLIDLEKNHGKAFAIFSGFNAAFKGNYENIGFWDADLATPLDMIPKFCKLLDSGKYHSVFGCRVQRLGSNIQRKAWRHYLGRFFATIISYVLKLPVYDTQCGAKIFRNNNDLKKAFTTPFKTKWVFDVELISKLQKLSKEHQKTFANTIYEFPLEEWNDVDGSKITFSDGFIALWDLIKIYLYKH